jgi:type II secretory pathway pseudopilin PulG
MKPATSTSTPKAEYSINTDFTDYTRIALIRAFRSIRVRSVPIRSQGFSLVEAILATAIFSLVISVFVGAIVYAKQGTAGSGDRERAIMLAEEGIEAARNIRAEAWNEVRFNESAIATSSNEWIFSGEGTSQTLGQYTRVLGFSDVCRDINNLVTTCPGIYTDEHIKLASTTVSWTGFPAISRSVNRVAYISNWSSIDWTQTDWSGNDGQTIWSDATKFDSQDGNIATSTSGQISIVSGDTLDDGFDLPTAINHDWPFTTSSNYTYDSSDIEVTSGVARLKQEPGTLVSGDTVNGDFDVDSLNWTYTDWEQPSATDVTGTHYTSGGNPTGYVDVSMPGKKNANSSGFWEQSFTTTVDNPSIATTTLDWIVSAYDGNLVTSFKAYAFVESSSGAPTLGNEVWASNEITGTTSWDSESEIDVASKLGTAGTYYLKIAARVTHSGGGGNVGTNTVGFDNVHLHWENTTGGDYPTNGPSIEPKNSLFIPSLESWDSFTETTDKDGGEIYYQLSDNSGSSWQYWNGAAWATAGASDSSTASAINTNITSFPVANESLSFKAFLVSDGSQLVNLDNLNVAFTAPNPAWAFFEWDVGAGEVTPLGRIQTSGGNPTNYVDILVPAGGNDEIGGYYEQAFKTYRDNPTGDTIDFNYKVVDYNGTPNVSDIRVYVDTASGIPTTQVGSSISISAEGAWTSATQIDPSSAITTAGVYYLKVALWVETPAGSGQNATGPFVIGFDNVNIDLGNGEHPTSADLTASAFDMGNASPVQVIEWDETIPSCSPTCTITFQLRSAPDSGGSPGTWTSWYGATGSGTNFTNSSSTMVSVDLNGNQWVQYRTDFTGDGDDTPVLTEVRVNYK